jgi:hypothetical protein
MVSSPGPRPGDSPHSRGQVTTWPHQARSSRCSARADRQVIAARAESRAASSCAPTSVAEYGPLWAGARVTACHCVSRLAARVGPVLPVSTTRVTRTGTRGAARGRRVRRWLGVSFSTRPSGRLAGMAPTGPSPPTTRTTSGRISGRPRSTGGGHAAGAAGASITCRRPRPERWSPRRRPAGSRSCDWRRCQSVNPVAGHGVGLEPDRGDPTGPCAATR